MIKEFAVEGSIPVVSFGSDTNIAYRFNPATLLKVGLASSSSSGDFIAKLRGFSYIFLQKENHMLRSLKYSTIDVMFNVIFEFNSYLTLFRVTDNKVFKILLQ